MGSVVHRLQTNSIVVASKTPIDLKSAAVAENPRQAIATCSTQASVLKPRATSEAPNARFVFLIQAADMIVFVILIASDAETRVLIVAVAGEGGGCSRARVGVTVVMFHAAKPERNGAFDARTSLAIRTQ